MFGASERQVDPVKHLIGSAMLWGGNPEKDALYLPINPTRNDGSTIYKLTVKDIPVDGFWSLTVYNGEGYLPAEPGQCLCREQHHPQNKPLTARSPSSSAGAMAKSPTALPISQGWKLHGASLSTATSRSRRAPWRFPEARPAD